MRPAIIVHGGAGRIPGGRHIALLEGCREAARLGWTVLVEGGSALDAVEAAVKFMEEDPAFNAGRGAVKNALGEVELDASIMEGKDLACGAVGAVKGVKHPIALARRIMEDGRHVLLCGEGARRFAEARGLPLGSPPGKEGGGEPGTVGCVALDATGTVAAGTSTGGIRGKLPGRVGDSALIGCGTYADSRGGVSCTGLGESIIRTVLAKSACDLLEHRAPMEAAQKAIALLERVRGEGGLILLNREGDFGHGKNTPHMAFCHIDGRGERSAIT